MKKPILKLGQKIKFLKNKYFNNGKEGDIVKIETIEYYYKSKGFEFLSKKKYKKEIKKRRYVYTCYSKKLKEWTFDEETLKLYKYKIKD